MELRLIREKLRLEQPMGSGRSMAVVTGEVTLPGGLREETRVLASRATACVESAEASAGRVNVRGRVSFLVLYTQGDPSRVRSVEATADFMHPCELAGVQPQAAAQAQLQVQRVEARASGGRMSLRAEVEAAVSAASLAPVEAIVAVEGSDEVQVLAHSQTISRTAARGATETLLREEIALPEGMQVTETLFATAAANVEAVTGGIGRVGLSGQLQLEATHASSLPGRPLVVTRHSIPFTQSVELSGEEGDRIDGRVWVKDVAVALQDDGDGRQVMRAEVLLGLEGYAEAIETLSIFEDAYTTSGDELRLKGRTVLARTGSSVLNAAESVRASMQLPEGALPVRTVLAAFVQPVMIQHELQPGRTVISGTLDTTLIYMSDDGAAPVSIRLSEPFRTVFAAETPEDALMTLAALEAEALPVTSDRVELRCILRMQAAAEEAQPVALITEGETTAPSPMTEDVVLYYTQPGEKLWDVARRYRVPVAGIQALNPGLKGELQPGQGVVVWRRSAGTCI